MKKITQGLFVLLALSALSGCHHRSDAVQPDGRPTAPSGQSVPGGPTGEGPAGQPQD